jgi:XTP/dITP diphosphohydrolase
MQKVELLFATTNDGKLEEAKRIGAAHGVTFYGLPQLSREIEVPPPIVSEGEASYEANAIRKARIYSGWSGSPTVADDTGLEIDLLGGLPGVFTARFGVARVCDLLGHHRSCEAVFVCCVAYAEPGGRVVSVTKRLAGHLATGRDFGVPHGPLPYSEIFTPAGESRPLSELIVSTAYRSHRGGALTALFAALS